MRRWYLFNTDILYLFFLIRRLSVKKIKKFIYTEIKLIKLSIKTCPIISIINLNLKFLIHLLPILSLKIYEILINYLSLYDSDLTNNNIISIFIIALLYLITDLIILIFTEIYAYNAMHIERKMNYMLDVQIMNKLSNVEVNFLENPDNVDSFNAAKESEYFLARNNSWLIDTMVRLVTLIISLIVLFAYDYFLFIIYVILTIPGTIIAFKQEKEMDQFSIITIPENKEKNYYKNLLTVRWFAKELRLYNLFDYLFKKYTNLWAAIREKRNKIFYRGFLKSFISILLLSLGYILTISFLTIQVYNKTIMVGTFILLLELVISTGQQLSTLGLDIITQYEIVIPRIELFIKFLNFKEVNNKGKKIDAGVFEIEFQHVYFKYPNSTNYVLNDLSFKINNKEKVAIVGENGAGKSTIIKLLLRYYQPEKGQIFINGIDLSEIELKDLYKKISVCFQDVSRYSLSLRANIYIGNIENKENNDEILKCINLSGVEDIFNESEMKNYDVSLTRLFDEQGKELSGGEWQKVALARCFFRNSEFLILDEPSSALDPIAEDKIFNAFKKICNKKGGILISHRLSIMSIVDKIIVLNNGKVVEVGCHEKLMGLKGLYYKMYMIQLSKYEPIQKKGECNE